jgi:hypothetical protein
MKVMLEGFPQFASAYEGRIQVIKVEVFKILVFTIS